MKVEKIMSVASRNQLLSTLHQKRLCKRRRSPYGRELCPSKTDGLPNTNWCKNVVEWQKQKSLFSLIHASKRALSAIVFSLVVR